MALIQWAALAVFAAMVLTVALYGLTASGHFPAEHRAETLKSAGGATLLWGTMALSVVTALAALFIAWIALPWTAAVIAGGGVLLMAPLVLQLFPDSFVDGRASLIAFSAIGAALSLAAMVLG